MKTALSIAGSDSSGGAGIQADLKTMSALGVYGMTAITSLTAQNTLGVEAILNVPPDFLASQIDSVFSDIYPDAVKIGMVNGAGNAEMIFERLKFYDAKNIVLDPVMVATSGSRLSDDESVRKLREIFPISALITPNIQEAEVLSRIEIKDITDMERAGKIIYESCGTPVLIKGGHLNGDDVLVAERVKVYEGEKIDNPNTHGTGCTFSSAIASYLSLGLSLEIAIKAAKEYVTCSIKSGLNLGRGRGPLNHLWNLKGGKTVDNSAFSF